MLSTLIRKRPTQVALSFAFVVALLGGATLTQSSSATAAPHCDPRDLPLPPACTTPPAPIPPAPASLSTTISLPAHFHNHLYVEALVPARLVTGVAFGDDTPYTVYLSCANGYSTWGQFRNLRMPPDPGAELSWSHIPPDSAAGTTCSVSTFDQVALYLNTAAVTIEPPRKTSSTVVTRVRFD